MRELEVGVQIGQPHKSKHRSAMLDSNTRIVTETDWDGVRTTRPMTDEEFNKIEADRKKWEHEHSPEVVLANCKRLASEFSADLLTLEDGFAVHAHVYNCEDTVFIKASTVAQLAYTLGILNDEIH